MSIDNNAPPDASPWLAGPTHDGLWWLGYPGRPAQVAHVYRRRPDDHGFLVAFPGYEASRWLPDHIAGMAQCGYRWLALGPPPPLPNPLPPAGYAVPCPPAAPAVEPGLDTRR